MMQITSAHCAVIQDLLRAVQDEEMTDLALVGCDGAAIPASRFVLSARSPVLKRMLCGSFRESSAKEIPLEYDGIILEAIVEYCCRNEIPKFRLYVHRNAHSARRLVQLYKAADYLQLTGLAKLVAQMAHNLTSRYPPLACAVYDEADLDTKVSRDALLIIQCRPYVTLPPDLETEGGIDCLCPSKLMTAFIDEDVKASELFLFEMLEKWLELCGYPEGRRVAQDCASHLHLEDIETKDLISIVKASGLCSDKSITDAITMQALRASQNHIWTLSSRGRPTIERILVEGAGSPNVNGIYYHINGLANGELYSKREVACGQQHVYTLSISPTEDGTTECRIFCSQLLTHKAIRTLAKNRTTRDPAFQPLLQIIKTEDDTPAEGGTVVSHVPTTFQNGRGTSRYTSLQISDGDHFIKARIKSSAIRNKGITITQNSLIKVLNFDKYVSDGCVAVHLKKIVVVSPDPGHTFGNPVYYFDLFDEQDEDDSQEIINAGETPIECEISRELMERKIGIEKIPEQDQTLLEMYSIRFAAHEKPIHSKIPSTGWRVDSHGREPVPKTRWIPGSSSKFKNVIEIRN